MKEQFTKGEWVFNGYDGSITDTTKAKNEIAMMNVDDWHNLGEGYANAHLIAQAPAMYEEIKQDAEQLNEFIKTLREHSDDWIFYKNELKRKEFLLAKCRGEK